MSKKLSNKEKQILMYIITNCERCHFNEEESLKYIKDNFPKPISRRTCYSYKNEMYKKLEKHNPYFKLLKMQRPRISKQWFSLSLINESENLIHKGSQNDIKLNEFDKFDECFYFSSQYLHKLYNRTEAVMDNTRKFLDKLETDRYSVNQNYKSIPDNAIIREEYIKCGKEFCLRCKHGPYYYAY